MCCADRKAAPITEIKVPMKRVVLNPFQDPRNNYSAQPALLTLQLGQKYFLPDKSYVRHN